MWPITGWIADYHVIFAAYMIISRANAYFIFKTNYVLEFSRTIMMTSTHTNTFLITVPFLGQAKVTHGFPAQSASNLRVHVAHVTLLWCIANLDLTNQIFNKPRVLLLLWKCKPTSNKETNRLPSSWSLLSNICSEAVMQYIYFIIWRMYHCDILQSLKSRNEWLLMAWCLFAARTSANTMMM